MRRRREFGVVISKKPTVNRNRITEHRLNMLNALKWKKTIITLPFLLAFALYLIWFETPSREAGAQRPQAGDPNLPNLIDAGKRHFEAHCVACHGADGKGGEGGPDIVSPENARRRSAD